MIQYFSQFFKPLMSDDDGDPLAYIWVGNDSYAACINSNTGRVYATLWNGSHGYFYPTIFVPFLQALRVRSRMTIRNLTLRGFPICGVELSREKWFSMAHAQIRLEELLNVLQSFQ